MQHPLAPRKNLLWAVHNEGMPRLLRRSSGTSLQNLTLPPTSPGGVSVCARFSTDCAQCCHISSPFWEGGGCHICGQEELRDIRACSDRQKARIPLPDSQPPLSENMFRCRQRKRILALEAGGTREEWDVGEGGRLPRMGTLGRG